MNNLDEHVRCVDHVKDSAIKMLNNNSWIVALNSRTLVKSA